MSQPLANNRFRAVLFDLDGTLLDTLEDLADSVNAALAKQGFATHSLAHFNTAVGDGAEAMLRRSLPQSQQDDETVASVRKIFVEEYSQRWNCKSHPYEGVHEMLDHLDKAGFAMCILSNKPDEFTRKVVSHFLGCWNFRIVRGALPGKPIKPDPGAAIEIADSIGVAPQHWLYLGDTDTDMRTAVAAGMFAVGVSWGFRDSEELKKNGADLIIDRPDAIIKLIS